MHKHTHSGCCGCHVDQKAIKRRTFLAGVGAGGGMLAAGGLTPAAAAADTPRVRPSLDKPALVVQPVLAYHLFQRREQTSWRPWGGLHTQADIDQEVNRIEEELKALEAKAEFPVEFKPVLRVQTMAEAEQARQGGADVMLIYGATAGVREMEALISPDRYNLVFVRHKSGPVYLWYEIVHPRLLRKTVDFYGQPGLTPNDVVVDEYGDVLWRLRALSGLKHTVGSRIACIGGPSGWGAGGQKAPEITRDLWKMDLVDVSYDDLGPRIVAARQDAARVKQSEADAEAYLKDAGVSLETDKAYVSRAFLLAQVFEDVMAEANCRAITVNHCMGTIMPLAETTACLTLSLINDAGYLAFCESDFAVIPSGILLHHIASVPVFLQDPTYPHHGVVTLAHCTAPRKMDGQRLEPARILTHFESDYGAAPKVDLRLGQVVTVIDPDFGDKKWIGFRGKVADNPFLDICRSQSDIAIEGDWRRLMNDMRGFHWMLCYGDYLRETGYALAKLGVGWYNLTEDRDYEA